MQKAGNMGLDWLLHLDIDEVNFNHQLCYAYHVSSVKESPCSAPVDDVYVADVHSPFRIDRTQGKVGVFNHPFFRVYDVRASIFSVHSTGYVFVWGFMYTRSQKQSAQVTRRCSPIVKG